MWKKSKQNIKFVLVQFLYSNINIQIWTPAQKFNLKAYPNWSLSYNQNLEFKATNSKHKRINF